MERTGNGKQGKRGDNDLGRSSRRADRVFIYLRGWRCVEEVLLFEDHRGVTTLGTLTHFT